MYIGSRPELGVASAPRPIQHLVARDLQSRADLRLDLLHYETPPQPLTASNTDMMNNYSFLSSDSNPNNPSNMQQNMQPRAPPSPSQAGSQYNGNGAQQNGIPMVNGLPSGGQQTDMNHLWAVVQQLSQVLEDNKQQTLGIVNGVNAVRARAAEEGGPVNGSFRQVNGELDGMWKP